AIAVGRKNYQILGSVVGGDTAAMLYALIGSCTALDVNPEQYLVDVLRRIDRETKVENLTPWGRKAQGGATPPGST
ncbi:MAG: transposase domain-containing protein, partial [Planctomycetes bacterium]|nr:transposase domain-containing protein [Planctomycetota bacterium]